VSDSLFNNRLYLTAVGISFVACLVLTPLVRRLAIRWRIVDTPDEHRKLHAKEVPLGGGIAIMLAFMLSVLVVATFSDSQFFTLASDLKFVIGLIVGACAICTVGIIDDRFGLRGRQKLLGQLAAATALIGSGLVIDSISIFNYSITLGLLAIPFTYFWILGAINSLNLLDGADGLATSVAVVLCSAIGGMAFLTGHPTEAFLACSMAGGLAAFLVYNRPPASIFLGDAGSMFIGLILGALAIRGSFKGPATVVLAVPLTIWAIPILDVCMAIVRRKLTGRSIYSTDRGHLHHRLQQHGLGNSKMVLTIGVFCACTAMGALISIPLHNELVAYGTMLVVVAVLVVTRIFGYSEFVLLLRRTHHLVYSFAPRGRRVGAVETRLQGDQRWDELWNTLTEFAERFDLSEVELNVHLPAIHEDYHAKWQRRDAPSESAVWFSDIPLIAEATTVGRLRISGSCQEDDVCTWMGDLIAGLKPFETHLLELVDDATSTGGEPPSTIGDATSDHAELLHPNKP
jgi:UDP-GlcNAc:undecaprenyl-phosphate GlcNAc-1-phosphate transferase